MRATIAPAAICALAASLAGGCATIVEGSDQTVTVSTVPAGATCELRRGGQLVGAVNPTPGSLVVDKSSDHISILCTKEGYEDAAGTLASEFQGMTFGNILFGGIIGVGVDAASGALNEYPPSVTITMRELPPEEVPAPASDDDKPADGLIRPEDVPTS